MTPDASFIPPYVTPPDPPEIKIVALVFSMVMLLLLVGFVGFVCIEFLADMLGHPLNVGLQQPPDISLFSEPLTTNEWKSPFELITPKDLTQMQGPDVVVLYTVRSPERPIMPPYLLIDNTLYPWEVQYGENTWFSRIHLPDGRHRLCIAETEIEFYTTQKNITLIGQDLLGWHRPHPDANKPDRCADCHEGSSQLINPLITGRGNAIGPWKGPASCFSCHEEEKHDAVHASLLPFSNQCVRCHPIH